MELARLGPRAFFTWVFITGPTLRRVFLMVFFVLAGWATYLFLTGVSKTDEMDRLFLQALTSTVGNASTYGSYIGMQALVLPQFREGRITTKDAELTPRFRDLFGEFQRRLNSETSELPGEEGNITTAGPGPDIANKYFTERTSHSFLFIPGVSLVRGRDSDGKPLTDVELVRDLLSNRLLTRDLQISRMIETPLCKFTETSVFKPSESTSLNAKPRQAYFITAQGLLRICEGDTTDQAGYYNGQFEPTTFFPDRPYFRNTLITALRDSQEVPSTNSTVSTFFGFVTDPYIDLGGNGVVLTACRALNLDPVQGSVLCLDFSFSGEMISEVQKRLSALGAIVTPVTCRVDDHNPDCSLSGSDREKPSEILLLQDRMRQSAQASRLSDIFGRIWVEGSGSDSLRFTVPIRQSLADGVRREDFLYCDLDLSLRNQANLKRAGLLTTALALFLFFMVSLIVDYGARMIEQRKAFDSIADVMYAAPVAYCRMDILSSRLIDFNEEFATLVGYKSVASAKEGLRGKKFQDLIADESKAKYETILQARKLGNPTGDYSLELRMADSNATVPVRVHAATVPTPEYPHGSFQQSFGVLIDETKSKVPKTEREVSEGERQDRETQRPTGQPPKFLVAGGRR